MQILGTAHDVTKRKPNYCRDLCWIRSGVRQLISLFKYNLSRAKKADSYWYDCCTYQLPVPSCCLLWVRVERSLPLLWWSVPWCDPWSSWSLRGHRSEGTYVRMYVCVCVRICVLVCRGSVRECAWAFVGVSGSIFMCIHASYV